MPKAPADGIRVSSSLIDNKIHEQNRAKCNYENINLIIFIQKTARELDEMRTDIDFFLANTETTLKDGHEGGEQFAYGVLVKNR